MKGQSASFDFKAIVFVLCLVGLLLFPELGYSQEAEIANYPNRPITFIIPLPAGGASDLGVRIITKEAEKFLGQAMTPVNKPGASMSLGVAAVAAAKPDGYTIGLSLASPMFVVPLLQKVPYHPVKDLEQIMQYSTLSNFGLLVKGDSPFKSLKELIEYARKNPKKLTYGCGVNSMSRFVVIRLCEKEKIELTHMPFSASPPAEVAVMGGHLDIAVGDLTPSLIEGGQTRPLVLWKREKGFDEYPEVPTLKDLGYDIPSPSFYQGVQGPKGIPEGILRKIEEAFTRAMKEPAFVKGMKDLRTLISYRDRKELGAYVANEFEVYQKFLKELGIIK